MKLAIPLYRGKPVPLKSILLWFIGSYVVLTVSFVRYWSLSPSWFSSLEAVDEWEERQLGNKATLSRSSKQQQQQQQLGPCAINLYGLLRQFKNLVLPGLKENVISINAKYLYTIQRRSIV